VDWSGRRVLVTGGRGFLGGAVVRLLRARGAVVVAVGRADGDLRDGAVAHALFAEARPAVVVHCAVVGGGIGWMATHGVEAGRDSSLLNLHALDAASAAGAQLFLGVSSACAYPRAPATIPFVEAELWDGAPEPTNAAYAASKRLMMELGRSYQAERGMRCAFPVLANLYGPGDPGDPARAHVLAALLQRCLAEPPELRVWGSGRPTREHLYVDDAAEGVLATADLAEGGPINIGSGEERSVAELARLAADATGYRGPLRFDPSRPDGQPRKVLDVRRARAELGFHARTPLEEGLRRTVSWMRSHAGAR
jgi:GDP-L-fucose synthase